MCVKNQAPILVFRVPWLENGLLWILMVTILYALPFQFWLFEKYKINNGYFFWCSPNLPIPILFMAPIIRIVIVSCLKNHWNENGYYHFGWLNPSNSICYCYFFVALFFASGLLRYLRQIGPFLSLGFCFQANH